MTLISEFDRQRRSPAAGIHDGNVSMSFVHVKLPLKRSRVEYLVYTLRKSLDSRGQRE